MPLSVTKSAGADRDSQGRKVRLCRSRQDRIKPGRISFGCRRKAQIPDETATADRPDRLTADAIRHGIANRLFAGSLQAPLPVAADSNVFLPGNGTPVCAEHGARAGPSGGGQGIQNVDGSTDAGGLSQTAGTGRIEDFNHNDRF